jgi:hypothetical protein
LGRIGWIFDFSAAGWRGRQEVVMGGSKIGKGTEKGQ